MKCETLKNAAVGSLVAATLVTGVIFLSPGWGEDAPPPAPGPVARARAAAGTGSVASLADLTALIRDREMWLRLHPRDEESWAVLGSAYVERGNRLAETADYPKAESALRRSLKVLPGERGNVDALVGLAALANARHDFAEARTLGERATKLKPKRWTAYPPLIDAYNGLGDVKAAGRAMDTLMELHMCPPVLGRAAQIYWNRGWREDAAATAYDAMMRAETPAEKADALHRLGELAWERGEPAEAVEHYDAALRAVRDHDRSLAGRARALAALGRTDEAFRDYQAALEYLPLPEYALEAGELYESLGLDGDARTQYELLRARAARAGVHGVNEELVLARFEADHGDPTSAVRRLQREWRRGHRSVYVADAMGWALYRAGRANAALPFAKRAMDQGLRSALFAYHRGEIERSLDLPGPARRHLAEALRTNPYFSPLLAAQARDALTALGEPPEGGPKDVMGYEREEVAAPESEGATDAGSDASSGSAGVPQRTAPPAERTPPPPPSGQQPSPLPQPATRQPSLTPTPPPPLGSLRPVSPSASRSPG
jgi:tetratricopeptide (TPR) repeat protein